MGELPPQDFPTASGEQPDEPQLGRGQRVRTRAQPYQPTMLVAEDTGVSELISEGTGVTLYTLMDCMMRAAALYVDHDLPLMN